MTKQDKSHDQTKAAPHSEEQDFGPTSSHNHYEDYLLARREIEDFPDDKIILINVDIPTAVNKVVGNKRNWGPYVERMAKLPDYDHRLARRCATFAGAAAYCNLVFLTATASPEVTGDLIAASEKLRDDFLVDLRAVIQHDLVPATAIAELRGGNGVPNLAFDLDLLVMVARQYFPKIEHRCSITMPDIDLGGARAAQLGALAVARGFKGVTKEEAGLTRQKSFSLFVYAYSQVRRGVGFYRWDDGDLEEIAPSIYAGKAAPKKATDGGDDSSDGGATGTTAAANTAGVSTSAAPASAGANATGLASMVVPSRNAIPGMGPSTPFGK